VRLAFVFLIVSSAHAQHAAAYGKLPMSFEPNVGQTNAHANFVARGPGYLLLLTPTGGTLCLSGQSKMRIRLAGGNPTAQAEGCSLCLVRAITSLGTTALSGIPTLPTTQRSDIEMSTPASTWFTTEISGS